MNDLGRVGGYGAAVRRKDDPPLPGEPFMSIADAKAMLRELHEAMAEIMVLRRLSTYQRQRDKAEAAIAVWRKYEAFLAGGPNERS